MDRARGLEKAGVHHRTMWLAPAGAVLGLVSRHRGVEHQQGCLLKRPFCDLVVKLFETCQEVGHLS